MELSKNVKTSTSLVILSLILPEMVLIKDNQWIKTIILSTLDLIDFVVEEKSIDLARYTMIRTFPLTACQNES